MRMLGWIVAVTAVVWCAGTAGSGLASTDSPHAKSEAKEASPAEHKVNINEAREQSYNQGTSLRQEDIAWRGGPGPSALQPGECRQRERCARKEPRPHAVK
jgi:hypothetical protein